MGFNKVNLFTLSVQQKLDGKTLTLESGQVIKVQSHCLEPDSEQIMCVDTNGDEHLLKYGEMFDFETVQAVSPQITKRAKSKKVKRNRKK